MIAMLMLLPVTSSSDVIHVAIESTPGPEFWIIAGTVASAVVAAFTGWLAFSTRQLAVETHTLAVKTADLALEGRTAQDLAQIQHQQMMLPVCRLTAGFTISNNSGVAMLGSGGIRNAGPGPAINVRIVAEMQGQQSHQWVYLGPVGPAESVPMNATLLTKFPYAAALSSAIVRVKYEDVFGQHFETTHMNDPTRTTYRGPLELRPESASCDY